MLRPWISYSTYFLGTPCMWKDIYDSWKVFEFSDQMFWEVNFLHLIQLLKDFEQTTGHLILLVSATSQNNNLTSDHGRNVRKQHRTLVNTKVHFMAWKKHQLLTFFRNESIFQANLRQIPGTPQTYLIAGSAGQEQGCK